MESVGQFVGNKAKGRISKQVFQESKPHQIFRKINISYPLIRTRTCACQVVRNVCFSENLPCFVFLKYPIWDSPFCLITEKLILCSQDCQQNKNEKMQKEFLPLPYLTSAYKFLHVLRNVSNVEDFRNNIWPVTIFPSNTLMFCLLEVQHT